MQCHNPLIVVLSDVIEDQLQQHHLKNLKIQIPGKVHEKGRWDKLYFSAKSCELWHVSWRKLGHALPGDNGNWQSIFLHSDHQVLKIPPPPCASAIICWAAVCPEKQDRSWSKTSEKIKNYKSLEKGKKCRFLGPKSKPTGVVSIICVFIPASLSFAHSSAGESVLWHKNSYYPHFTYGKSIT